MSQMDLEGARKALREHSPTDLLNLRESVWLEVKSQPYNLRDPGQREEFAKDVAAMANGGGGLLILGIKTRDDDREEVLDHIVPVDRTALDLDQLRMLIRERVTPELYGVIVDWSEDSNGAVVFIDISLRPDKRLYVVAAPTGKPGQVNRNSVQVPMRDAAGTRWMTRTDIQRLLQRGFEATPGVFDRP